MRRCSRSEELRAALAAEEPIEPGLKAHVAACPECSVIRAEARRFAKRLDAAMEELVTDDLPSGIVSAARMAPAPQGRRVSFGTLFSAVATTSLVAFAVVGVVVTGTSISDAMRGGPAPGSASAQAGFGAVSCYVGEPMVEVTVEQLNGEEARAVAAFCIGAADDMSADRRSEVTCALSEAGDALVESADAAVYAGAILYACTGFETDAARSAAAKAAKERADDADTAIPVRSTTLHSWAEAGVRAGWPVNRPGWLPDGYQLAALQGFATSDAEAVDSVVALYLRNGVPLTIDQFAIADPDAFRVELSIPGEDLGEVSTGRTTIGGQTALWVAGLAAPTARGVGFDTDTLVLTWREGDVGYRITGSSTDLEDLRRIAESLGEG